MNKKLLVGFVFGILLIGFLISSVYVKADEDDVQFCILETPTFYINLNESNQWNDTVGFPPDCLGNNYVYGVDPSDNTWKCRVDQTGIGSNWTFNAPIYNISDDVYLNMSFMNETMDQRDDDTDTQKNASGYLYNDTTTIYLNETVLNNTIESITNSTTYLPWNITTVSGTLDDGNLTSILTPEDGDSYNVSEASGASPSTIVINFTDVSSFDSVIGRIHYAGGLGHEIQVEIYRYDTKTWENYIELTDTNDFVNIYIPVFDPVNHVNGTNASIRFYHVQSGVPTHDLFIDYLVLIEGFTALTVADHDALGGRDDIDNHPWALPTNGSLRNASSIIVTNNVTADWFLGSINASNVQNEEWIEDSQESNLNVNSSDFWDTYNITNTSQFQGTNILSINWTWLDNFITIIWNTLWGAKTTDDLTEGSSNLYDNQSWNASEANATGYITDWNSTGYIKDWNGTELVINWSNIITPDNTTFNETLTDSKYMINNTGGYAINMTMVYIAEMVCFDVDCNTSVNATGYYMNGGSAWMIYNGTGILVHGG